MSNSILTLAHLALTAYDDKLHARDGFSPLDGSAFGISAASTGGKVKWSYTDGIYRATLPDKLSKNFKDSAVADVYTRLESDGSTTLALAFRGTDGIELDKVFGWGPQMKKGYYPLYRPLIDQIKTFITSHNVDKVLITGHSLGAAMAQYALHDLQDTANTDFRAVIFGTPGAVDSGNAPDARLIEFEYSGDAFTKLKSVPLVSFDHQGQRIVMPLDSATTSKDDGISFYEHKMERYLKAVENFVALGNETPHFIEADSYAPNNKMRIYAGGTGNDHLKGDGRDDTLLGGDGNDGLNGRGGDDKLSGGNGNDRLIGGPGHDTLLGGADNDTFVFNQKPIAPNADIIIDFNPDDDVIALAHAVFRAIGKGSLQDQQFIVAAAAQDADDRIIYNSSTGALSYDRDGTGQIHAVHIATVTAGLQITAADFLIV